MSIVNAELGAMGLDSGASGLEGSRCAGSFAWLAQAAASSSALKMKGREVMVLPPCNTGARVESSKSSEVWAPAASFGVTSPVTT